MWSRALDALFPSYCELCQRQLDHGKNICAPCLARLPRLSQPFCDICADPFPGNIEDTFTCPNCHDISFDFDFARAALTASIDSLHLIHEIKYQRQFQLARDLAPLLRELIAHDPKLQQIESPILIPVPLHRRRQIKRWGNQAEEIARNLAQISQFTCLLALRRIRHTTTQTRLTRQQRLQNLKNAFALKKNIRERLQNRTIFLIDDVFTTGSTAQQCAHVLKKEAGAKQIISLCLVRG